MTVTSTDVSDLVDRARSGQARAVARLISMVEQQSADLAEVAAQLAPHTREASVIGLTGSPGVGKATSTGALVSSWRRHGKRGGVLNTNEPPPFSGGALLGDRI